MIECPACHHVFEEPVHRWVDEMADAVERDATSRLEADVTVREPVAPPEDELRAEIGVHP